MTPIIRYHLATSITNARWNNAKSKRHITWTGGQNPWFVMWTTNSKSKAPFMTHTFLYLSYQIYSCYTSKPTHLIFQIWCDSQKWQPAQEENQPSATSDCEAQSALALLAFASIVKFPPFQFSSKSSVLQPLFSSQRKIIFRVWVPPIPHDMSQPLCLNISFCVSVYNIFLFLFTFPNFASLSSSFEQVLICSRYSARST